MVQLAILTGKTAGSLFKARRFPFSIGRAPGTDLRLEEAGVWDKHARVRLEPKQGFFIDAESEALISVNGESCQSAPLRNGDMLDIGSVKARFWLAPAKQKRMTPREAFLWFVVCAVTLGQVALIYFVSR